MGWGCNKHEWDAGSEDWIAAMGPICDERLERHNDWGRQLAICPKCWLEREAQLSKMLLALKAARRRMGISGWGVERSNHPTYQVYAEVTDAILAVEGKDWLEERYD